MKRAILAIMAIMMLGATGCFHNHCHSNGRFAGPGQGHGDAGFVPTQPGPPAATVGYPYYTTRGPRDFLVNDPASIGY
jgi:hypothetical protein